MNQRKIVRRLIVGTAASLFATLVAAQGFPAIPSRWSCPIRRAGWSTRSARLLSRAAGARLGNRS